MRLQSAHSLCGAASVANALRALGRPVSEDQVVAAIHAAGLAIDPMAMAGAGARTLQVALEAHGYRGDPVTFSDPDGALDALWARLVGGRPSLLAVDADEHWVAAIGVCGPRYLVADPAHAEIVLPATGAELLRRWKGGDPPRYYAMDIRPLRRPRKKESK